MPVADRLLPESAAAQARSLEGRPLTMYSSLMLPDRSRLRLLESPPASGEQRRPMPAPGGQAGSARREAEADESLVGRVQQASLLVRRAFLESH